MMSYNKCVLTVIIRGVGRTVVSIWTWSSWSTISEVFWLISVNVHHFFLNLFLLIYWTRANAFYISGAKIFWKKKNQNKKIKYFFFVEYFKKWPSGPNFVVNLFKKCNFPKQIFNSDKIQLLNEDNKHFKRIEVWPQLLNKSNSECTNNF